MRILFTCGGTGGHIYPAIAVAQIFRNRERGTEILFVGAEGAMETRVVPAEGFALRTVRVSNLAHSLNPKALGKNLKSAAHLVGALRESGKIIKEFRPDIVIGTGGYACFPVIFKAHEKKIPTLMHESNATPGLTTKLLAKRVDRVMTGFAGVENQFPDPKRVFFTGTPVRESFMLADKSEARRSMGLDRRPVILSAFGSLGAGVMNTLMTDILTRVAKEGLWQVIHAAGSRYYESMSAELEKREVRGSHIRVSEYIHDMPQAMAAADLYIGRAGASFLTELMVTGTPAILIPSPNVTKDHQTVNAKKLQEQCGTEVLAEAGLTSERLYDTIAQWLGAPERRQMVSEALTRAAVPDAAERIYTLAKILIGEHK